MFPIAPLNKPYILILKLLACLHFFYIFIYYYSSFLLLLCIITKLSSYKIYSWGLIPSSLPRSLQISIFVLRKYKLPLSCTIQMQTSKMRKCQPDFNPRRVLPSYSSLGKYKNSATIPNFRSSAVY